jgi:hypothetical protein
MKPSTSYWIAVASKDHVQHGVEGGFMQVSHGRQAPLKRLSEGDWVLFYSPKVKFEGEEKLQAFTAVGQVLNDRIYQVDMSEGFSPFRRDVSFLNIHDTPITPLLNELQFVENKKSWGYKFRFGLFEIGEEDFLTIKEKMITHV